MDNPTVKDLIEALKPVSKVLKTWIKAFYITLKNQSLWS